MKKKSLVLGISTKSVQLYGHRTTPLICLLIIIIISFASCTDNKNKGMDKESAKEGSTHVATSDPRTPQEEREGFHLPPGFKIELFASEPVIHKPMNLAFDAQGRLWVTHSLEYPFPSKTGQGQDRITILEDTDRDGKADKHIRFADSLNIPIGILPVSGGAIGYSIASVYKFFDKNGDDRSDVQERLYDGFGYKDTHGMVNNLARSFDGWIYACHGFANESAVSSIDGDSVHMESGHTFRFTRDGRNIEVMTTGRVNPFALTFDKWGYRYSSDSHSDPLYQLIPGGDYPHFGKKATGIGFGPHMMDHDHGPTAIAGAALNDHGHFPPEYRNSFFNGNVRTGKIFRDSLAWYGTTPQAVHKGTFLTSDDPWFRPVAMTFGPDGALYVADFYNRIIGHYEVPLDHPGRDRRRGRIWRISYTGEDATDIAVTDWSSAPAESLLEGLNSSHLKTRLQVADQLVDRMGKHAINPVRAMVTSDSATSLQRAHGLWVLHRLEALPDELLSQSEEDGTPLIRTHAMRILGESLDLSQSQHNLLVDGLSDESPHVQRAAVQALARHPRIESTEPVLRLMHQVPEYDTHLRYVTRLALRNHLRKEEVMQKALATNWEQNDARVLASAILGVPSAGAGDFLIDFISRYNIPPTQMVNYVRHMARYLPASRQSDLVGFIQKKYSGNLNFQQTLFKTVQEGVAQRGATLGPRAKSWGVELASKFFDGTPSSKSDVWHNSILADSLDHQNPWVVDQKEVKGQPPVPVLTSAPRGEHLTGVLSSPVFTLPESFGFLLFGEGDSSETSLQNIVRLRLKETGQIIKEELLLNKSFQQVDWALSEYKGQEAVLEVVDATGGGGHSYIAVGGFTPSVIRVPTQGPANVSDQLQFAAEIAQTFHVYDFEPRVQTLLGTQWMDVTVRVAAAQALMDLAPSKYISGLEKLITDRSESVVLRKSLGEVLVQQGSAESMDSIHKIIPDVPQQVQLGIARSMANSVSGANRLLTLGRSGALPESIMKDPIVGERMGTGKPEKIQVAYEQLIGKQGTGEEDKERLIRQRLANFTLEKASLEKGEDVFDIYCAACHQVNGEGGVVGPQLDGIGGQGPKALAEAILAPNASVAESFKLNTITLKNGKVQSGLFRRQEGELLVFANTEGEEFSIAKNDIEKREISSSSLMPSSFGRMLSEEQFHNLLAYMLNIN